MLRRLKVSLAAVKTAISRAPAARASSKPVRLGTSTGSRTPSGFATRRRTSSEPAICGTHFGETKAPTSTTGRPAATSRSQKATRSSTERGAASFCRPSRGPTSTTVTRRGRLTRAPPAAGPGATMSPAETWTARTTPSLGARRAFSIFMASTTRSSSPFATRWPAATLHRGHPARHRGLEGARVVPGRRPRAPSRSSSRA